MRSLSLLILTVAIGGCAPVQPVERSPQADAHLQSLLAGRTASPPISCLSDYRSNDMVVIDDSTVLFRDGRTVYRNDFQGGSCNHLGSGFFALLTRRTGGIGLCRGDIAEVIDTGTGMTVGSCVIGDFVPYTKPSR
ncbi:hypothetical protein [Sphingomonas sp.]|uniref:hypothetical protein n=1 Tax=Sphingomonas sp. TaxID=28214 RepID=UPI00286AA275|nr:hypothetical protein [Sphingomonas sp.]